MPSEPIAFTRRWGCNRGRGEDVVATLDHACRFVGDPKTTPVDQDSEFLFRDLDLRLARVASISPSHALKSPRTMRSASASTARPEPNVSTRTGSRRLTMTARKRRNGARIITTSALTTRSETIRRYRPSKAHLRLPPDELSLPRKFRFGAPQRQGPRQRFEPPSNSVSRPEFGCHLILRAMPCAVARQNLYVPVQARILGEQRDFNKQLRGNGKWCCRRDSNSLIKKNSFIISNT